MPAVAKPLGLDQALVDQRAQAVIGAAQAHAEGAGQIALGQLRVVREQAQGLEAGVFGHATALPVQSCGGHVSS